MIFAPSLMFANFCFNYTTKKFSITIKMSQLLIAASSRIRTERVYTGPHRVGPNRPGWARSISALKLLNILRDVTTNMAEQ